MNAEQSEVSMYKFWGRMPQNLMGSKDPYKLPSGTNRIPAEGGLNASIYIYIYICIHLLTLFSVRYEGC